jgi:hypothetical protein
LAQFSDLKKWPKVKNRPRGENSPNLVTLARSAARSLRNSIAISLHLSLSHTHTVALRFSHTYLPVFPTKNRPDYVTDQYSFFSETAHLATCSGMYVCNVLRANKFCIIWKVFFKFSMLCIHSIVHFFKRAPNDFNFNSVLSRQRTP